jgi:hypothetical protein
MVSMRAIQSHASWSTPSLTLVGWIAAPTQTPHHELCHRTDDVTLVGVNLITTLKVNA